MSIHRSKNKSGPVDKILGAIWYLLLMVSGGFVGMMLRKVWDYWTIN